MTDDIVKYLRLSGTRFNRHIEAADEIELLRTDRDRWRTISDDLHSVLYFLSFKDIEVTTEELKTWDSIVGKYDKAVRGD